MGKLDLIIFTLQQKYKNHLLTDKLKEIIKQDCMMMYKQLNLENTFGKLTDVVIDIEKGNMNIDLILSK